MKYTNPLNNLEWQGNSRKMYQAILNAVPSIFIGSVKKNIVYWITKNNITTVTEDTVFQAVNEIAPSNIANRIRPELEKLRS